MNPRTELTGRLKGADVLKECVEFADSGNCPQKGYDEKPLDDLKYHPAYSSPKALIKYIFGSRN
jgi:hypothetical protein